MKRALTLLCCGILSLAFVSHAWATIQDPVAVEQGKLSGAPGKNADVRVYRGIPYAAPPVGDLRWKPPQPAPHWAGVRRATEFGNDCMQPELPPNFPEVWKSLLTTSASKSEDCLYVNVWTPSPCGGGSEIVRCSLAMLGLEVPDLPTRERGFRSRKSESLSFRS